jgi:hypothetical protein
MYSDTEATWLKSIFGEIYSMELSAKIDAPSTEHDIVGAIAVYSLAWKCRRPSPDRPLTTSGK